MAKTPAVALAAAAAAIVLLGTGVFHSGSFDEDAPLMGSGDELRRAETVSIAAPSAQPSPPSSTTGPSLNERPYELDELLRQSKLGEAWLTAHGFTSGAALQGLHTLLDGRANLASEPRVRLAARPSGAAEGTSAGVPRLSSGERYVLATLTNVPMTGDDSVLVRWRRTSDDTVMELSAQAMSAAGEPLQLWMHTPQDWAPGSYRLEVISANPRLEPLAAADFEIVASDAAVTAFSYPVQATAQR
jgi:hypothetical protein